VLEENAMGAKPVRQEKPVSDDFYYPQADFQKKRRLVTETYEYEMPFKYENISVRRFDMMGREPHGVEMNMVNYHHPQGEREPHDLEGDCITLEEESPIVRVVVMGSACTPPGYVQLECEPVEGWRNRFESPGAMPARFRINNLWGMHMRVDALCGETRDVKPLMDRVEGTEAYGELPEGHFELHKSARGRVFLKASSHENPLAGMSCAIFEIPPSHKVHIQGGSEIPGWQSDNFPGDHHYSFRCIRVSVVVSSEDHD